MEGETNTTSLEVIPCEPCKVKWEDHKDGIVLATMYCVDCEENLCESCSNYHITLKIARNHKVVSLNKAIKQIKTENETETTDPFNPTANVSFESQRLKSPANEKDSSFSSANINSDFNENLTYKPGEYHHHYAKICESKQIAAIDESTKAEENEPTKAEKITPAINLTPGFSCDCERDNVSAGLVHKECYENKTVYSASQSEAVPNTNDLFREENTELENISKDLTGKESQFYRSKLKLATDESTRSNEVEKMTESISLMSEMVHDPESENSLSATALNELGESKHHSSLANVAMQESTGNNTNGAKTTTESRGQISGTVSNLDGEVASSAVPSSDSNESRSSDSISKSAKEEPNKMEETNQSTRFESKSVYHPKDDNSPTAIIIASDQYEDSQSSSASHCEETEGKNIIINNCLQIESDKKSSSISDSVGKDSRGWNIKPLRKKFHGWLTDTVYTKLNPIIQKPFIDEQNVLNFWQIVSPYLIQRIKMWNGNVLSPQTINSFFKKQKPLSRKKVNQTTISPTSVSRIDFLTLMINTADPIVGQDILVKLSKFHTAIPLIVQDIRENGKFIVTLPTIRGICIKCETGPGEIMDNYLFSNEFRMIVAVRIGNSKTGKSTILNQMMRKPNMFSSCDEPNSASGRPHTLEGMVEMTWLTQDTCSDRTWEALFIEHNKTNPQEVVLLANLHGDATQCIDTITFLATRALSFILFQMPDYSNEQFNRLIEIVSSDRVVQVLVDPENNEADTYEIFTDTLRTDDIQSTLTSVLEECLSTAPKIEKHDPSNIGLDGFENILRFSETVECQEADAIVEFVRENGCLKIKQLMKDIRDLKSANWSPQMMRLIEVAVAIFGLPTKQAKASLTFLETLLSKLSGKESVSAQADVHRANEKLRKIVKTPKKRNDESNDKDHQHDAELKSAREELQRTMKKVDDHNLGQEHFFRILGQIYSKSMTDPDLKILNSIQCLPGKLAELLINGHAIEILDGESGDIQSIWIQAIFRNVEKKRPNLRVFVISIIGVQSSGKSTLLNALFSCRFAVSIGRCSRGLFMRMIFLDGQLRQSHGFDCILLIDTEGLCSPEKMNDELASQKDRLMATFAMGISNLTIVNILGEGMTEMTEILQIAIVAMTRLRSGGIRPDILMVQHLQERNEKKMELAKGQFCEAINKAFELINKNDVELASASAECLTELVSRIHSGDLFKHFGAFKDGSSVNSCPSETYHDDVVRLYETLLDRAKFCKTKSTFKLWSTHFESYWKCAKQDNFALNFKNIKHITEFLYFEKMVANVKEELDGAIRFHREIFSRKIKEVVGSLMADKKTMRTDVVKELLLKDIGSLMEQIPMECVGKTFDWKTKNEISCYNQSVIDCEACKIFRASNDQLLTAISETEWEQDVKKSLNEHRDRLRRVTLSMLSQTFDGTVVRQGYFSEFSDAISKELENALAQRPHGKYTDEERKQFVDRIWSSLQQIAASKETQPEMRENMFQAIFQEYGNTEVPELFKSDISLESIQVINLSKPSAGFGNFLTNMMKKMIPVSNAQNKENSKLSENQMKQLTSDLNQFITNVLQGNERKPDSLEFARVKVREIKMRLPTLIGNFEKSCNLKLKDKFRRDLEIYTFQQVCNKLSASNTINERMIDSLNLHYVQNGLHTNFWKTFEAPVTVDTLQRSVAAKSPAVGDRLEEKLIRKVMNELDNLVYRIFQNRDDNWRTAGLNFEDGMVREIKNSFSETVKSFAVNFRIALHVDFKLLLQIYTLQQLRDKMVGLQAIWNRENKPSEILKQKRKDYLREIEARLECGFSAAGEALVVATILSKAIKETAIQEAYSLKLKTVKDVPWTTNSEKVRLHYFEKLAEEVARGDKKRVLKHFQDPKNSIEEWFMEEVDSMHDKKKVNEIYHKTLAKELKEAISKIRNCSAKPEIDTIIESYIKFGDDQYYSKCNGAEIDFETFKSALVSRLREYPKSEEGRMENCLTVSEDPLIMGRLGCTEHCYWCGALCWGSRDHQSGKDTGRKIEVHHSCHQPPGLAGTHDRNTNRLSVDACHLWKDKTRVYFGEYHDSDDGLLWSVAKAENFKDWKFDAHYVTMFDELMRWFFQELNEDIAQMHGRLPANEDQLQEYHCTSLKLEEILTVVRSKI